MLQVGPNPKIGADMNVISAVFPFLQSARLHRQNANAKGNVGDKHANKLGDEIIQMLDAFKLCRSADWPSRSLESSMGKLLDGAQDLKQAR